MDWDEIKRAQESQRLLNDPGFREALKQQQRLRDAGVDLTRLSEQAALSKDVLGRQSYTVNVKNSWRSLKLYGVRCHRNGCKQDRTSMSFRVDLDAASLNCAQRSRSRPDRCAIFSSSGKTQIDLSTRPSKVPLPIAYLV